MAVTQNLLQPRAVTVGTFQIESAPKQLAFLNVYVSRQVNFTLHKL